MGKELIPVRDRLEKMQKTNFKSLSDKPYEKSVEQEIEELKAKRHDKACCNTF